MESTLADQLLDAVMGLLDATEDGDVLEVGGKPLQRARTFAEDVVTKIEAAAEPVDS